MFFTVYNADLRVVDDVRVKQSVSAFKSPSEGSVDRGNGWFDKFFRLVTARYLVKDLRL